MNGRTFIDTNVLVYCFDAADPAKKQRALSILHGEDGTDDLVISTQVLLEFYVTVVRKLAQPLDPADAERAVHHISSLPIVQPDVPMVHEAIAASQRFQLSLWDALILQAAADSGCKHVLSEDLQDGFTYGPVRVHNPFV